MLRFFLFLGLWFSLKMQAQLLLAGADNNTQNSFSFNAKEIKKRKIKSIVFELVDKQDFKIAENKDLSRHYEFDSLGRLTRSYYTVVKKIIEKEYHAAPVYRHNRLVSSGGVYTKETYEFDTLFTRYFYDNKGNLIGKRYNDGSFYNATYYKYDSLNRVVSLLSCKETNASIDKSTFTLGMQHINFEEKYQYINASPLQYKQQFLNDENRIFKELIVSFNADKQPIRYNENYIATWINQSTYFVYNEAKQLIEKKYTSNASENMELKETYEYDSRHLLNTEKKYKNNVLQTETGYIYDAETQVPTSFVTRDYINKSMLIVKMVYHY
ncbi:MAG: hypothetical protein JST67_10945 [Bacteroidetes bacterium]|nr:hypothetical protein [Bacteroidota bacterium]